MAPGKYIGQVFTEKVEIYEGESTFENCVFEEGVLVKGNSKSNFLSGEFPSASFKACSFHGENEPSVSLWHFAQCSFVDCQMFSKKCITLRIDIGAHGTFNSCKIDYIKCAAAIMPEASGDFENCSFRCSGDAAAGLPALPIYFDANNKERTRLVNNTLNGERLYFSYILSG